MSLDKLRGVRANMELPKLPERGRLLNVKDALAEAGADAVDERTVAALGRIDVAYRTLCSILYNYVPLSGHPGGSISSGTFVEALLYNVMDYDVGNPLSETADIIVYAAGHKAMGLYAMWALRDELVRIGDSKLLPGDIRQRLRFEDLLGFRRNPTQNTPLFKQLKSKALDGHPTPATPFVPVATGASGVGVPSALGLALGALDLYPAAPPRVHMIEGEGGMTPGRVSEALAAAASAQLSNVVLHVDWNQSSIDSDRVCAEGGKPGDYVQWNPLTFCAVHDWNVLFVPDGRDHRQILAAQALAATKLSDQPTAIVYRTTKGWHYGIEGRKSHGAGHKFCSPEFYATLEDFAKEFKIAFPHPSCIEADDHESLEAALWELLGVIRTTLEKDQGLAKWATEALVQAKSRLVAQKRVPRKDAPKLEPVFEANGPFQPTKPPAEMVIKPGTSTTLRGAVGDVLGHLNKATGGAFFGSAADLYGSTSLTNIAVGFPGGFYNAVGNAGARLLAVGGICEDAMGAMAGGLAAYGHHVGVTSSYGAFIAALEHVPARLHAIGQQMRNELTGGSGYRPFIIINAHAGVKTGEDGPTHADPQALQLFAENFPRGTMITLTPWEPNEAWPLLLAALQKRPAVISPFVTRPNEKTPDREALGLAPATAAVEGVYLLAKPTTPKPVGTVVLQGSEVAIDFVDGVLPELRKAGIDLYVYYVSSAELFDLLPEKRQHEIFPEERAREALGMTGFTLPTLYRFVTSEDGRRRTLHPFRGGHFLGSGKANKVLEQGGLDAAAQLKAIRDYAASRK
jgi:transketolase